MNVLGIETSCDETSAAVFSGERLLSNVIASQVIHQKYGGVVPELASRAHISLISSITDEALKQANLMISDINGIAVTYGPGLVGSILVGLNFAKALAYTQNIPWIGINHIEGHIFANFVYETDLTPPFMALIISGGHTQLVYVQELGNYQIVGKTKDDAAGEAFDKVAQMLQLGYPGGPIIDNLAKNGNVTYVDFPRAMLRDENYDFSFSGLKTAVLYYLHGISNQELEGHNADIVASFQAALVDVLVEKTCRAAKQYGVKHVALAGGVACNSYLRAQMKLRIDAEQLKIHIPASVLCTDNAAMIACTGKFKLQRGEKSSYILAPKPSLKL